MPIEIQMIRKSTLHCKLNQIIEADIKHGNNNEIKIHRKKLNIRGKQNVAGADLEFICKRALSIGRQTSIS